MKKLFERCSRIAIMLLGLMVMTSTLSVAHAQLPPIQRKGAVEYMTGGISIDESMAMRAAAKNFELELLFAEREGNRVAYLSNIGVDIRDVQGNSVLQTTSQGPYMLLRLPAGQYIVSANRQGNVLTRRVTVDHYTTVRTVFEWQPQQ